MNIQVKKNLIYTLYFLKYLVKKMKMRKEMVRELGELFSYNN